MLSLRLIGGVLLPVLTGLPPADLPALSVRDDEPVRIVDACGTTAAPALEGCHAAAPPPSGEGYASQASPVIRAHRTDAPPRIDGVLDEEFWQEIVPETGFVQRNPVDGAEASERTEVRVAYDDNNIYFGFTMYDREPDKIRRSILHREGRIDQDDQIIIALDSYHDRRNGYIFELNAFGTQGDAWFNDERLERSDWNWEGVYSSAARIEAWGWVLEVAIPTTTIRFPEDDEIEMGVAFRRVIRRKNEEVFLPHISQDYRSGIHQASQYATLTGLQGLKRGNDLEIKPYGLLGGENDFATDGTEVTGDVGLDVKWGITSNFTLDVTLNTDFAQVETDNVQINLTRFNLFFPEKREFFLERAGLFQFGNEREADIFFSRRIGIENDIIGGARLTGQQGPFSIGVLDLQTDDAPERIDDGGENGERKGANNFVGRVRHDILPRTTVGAIFTNLQNSGTYNRVAGVDYQTRFFTSSSARAWFAQVWDKEDGTAGNAAGFVDVNLTNDRYTAGINYTNIGENFDPALGFVRRRDMVRWAGHVGFTPRFESSSWARRLSIFLGGARIKGQDDVLQSWNRGVDVILTFDSGDRTGADARQFFERLIEPFSIREDAVIPSGDYPFTRGSLTFGTNESRRYSARANVEFGGFWHGTRRTVGGRFNFKQSEHFSVSVFGDYNDVSLPIDNGDFSTTIFGSNIGFAFNRELFANALIQYDTDSDVARANIRIDWIHTPGSDLFLVFDTGYRTGFLEDPRESRWVNRTGVVKLTYLRAF